LGWARPAACGRLAAERFLVKKVKFVTMLWMSGVGVLLLAAFAGCGFISAATITGISVSEGSLTPAFDAAVTSYSVSVPNSVSSINVTVETTNPAVTATINGTEVLPGDGTASITLAVGVTTVVASATNGTDSVEYTIDITRADAPEINIVGKLNYSDIGTTDIPSGSTIDFESQGGDVTMAFTIENNGGLPLTLTGTPLVEVVNGQASIFYEVTAQPLSATIPVGGSDTFELTFRAFVDFIVGTKTGTVTIENDDPDEETFELSLTGFASCG